MLTSTIAVSQNVGGVCRSCRMAGQVRRLGKRDRQGRQKMLISTIAVSPNVNGICRS